MEGHQNAKSYSSYKSAEYGKRSSGDITAVCLSYSVAHIVKLDNLGKTEAN